MSKLCRSYGQLFHIGCYMRILRFDRPSRLVHTSRMSFKKIQAALVDLSGTLHIEDRAIEGAPDALQRLRDSGIKVKFVTNTTKEPLRILHSRLRSLKFNIQKEEIFTSLTAASNLVRERGLRPLLYIEDSAKEDFSGVSEENPNAVVIGLSPKDFDYSPMNKAFRLILDGAPLIAIHKARYFKKKDGIYLGPGPFVSGLEFATDTKAEVVGKPEERFFLEAIRDLDCDPSHAIMIGDDVRDDVGGAMAAGMMGILVQTGKYRPRDEQKIQPQPTSVGSDFKDAVDFIIHHNSVTDQ